MIIYCNSIKINLVHNPKYKMPKVLPNGKYKNL